jgi:hypothetical protein
MIVPLVGRAHKFDISKTLSAGTTGTGRIMGEAWLRLR